jgi:hypothetical protein
VKLIKAFQVVGAIVVSGTMINAQQTSTPPFEVGSTYSWPHFRSDNNSLQSVRSVSGYCEHNLNKTAGLVVSFCDYAHTRIELDELLMPSLFVPRVNSRRAFLRPYYAVPIRWCAGWNGPGGISMDLNAFATSAEEFDYRRTKHISTKAIQVKYVLTKSTNGFGSFQDDVGYSAGVVFKFRGPQ